MPEILSNLRDDHRNFGKLLKLLSEQVSLLTRGEFINYQLLADIMQYFTHYPDIYHHTHEDRICDILKIRALNTSDLINRINMEHKLIAKTGTEILDEIKKIQGNGIFSREKFAKQLYNFNACYQDHIKIEESDLFRMVEKILKPQDWQNISASIQTGDDPLFGRILAHEYQELFRAILTEVTSENSEKII